MENFSKYSEKRLAKALRVREERLRKNVEDARYTLVIAKQALEIERTLRAQFQAALYAKAYHSDEQKANACLISAAPDLYEACKAFLEAWDSMTASAQAESILAMRAALKKAEGVSDDTDKT